MMFWETWLVGANILISEVNNEWTEDSAQIKGGLDSLKCSVR